MAPAGGGAENGVGGIFPCWNAAATLGGKRKKKKRKERIPGKKKHQLLGRGSAGSLVRVMPRGHIMLRALLSPRRTHPWHLGST